MCACVSLVERQECGTGHHIGERAGMMIFDDEPLLVGDEFGCLARFDARLLSSPSSLGTRLVVDWSEED